MAGILGGDGDGNGVLDFNLSWNITVDQSGAAELDNIIRTIGDVSAVFDISAHASDLSSVFWFSSDSSDVDDLSVNDLKFACNGANWPDLSYSASLVRKGGEGEVPAGNFPSYTDTDANRGNDPFLVTSKAEDSNRDVRHDMVRQLAYLIFGPAGASSTDPGNGANQFTDIFSNEDALRTEIANQDNSITTKVKTEMSDNHGTFDIPKNNVSDGGDEAQASCAQVIFNSMLSDEDRRIVFYNISGDSFDTVSDELIFRDAYTYEPDGRNYYRLKFRDGDKINFTVTYTTATSASLGGASRTSWSDADASWPGITAGHHSRKYKVVLHLTSDDGLVLGRSVT